MINVAYKTNETNSSFDLNNYDFMILSMNTLLDDDLFDLSGKVVVLTGASGFLGKQYAHALCQANAIVILADIDLKESKKLTTKLKTKYSTQIMPIKTDLTNKQSIKNLVSKVVEKFSRIDVLINNAMFHENKKELTTPFEKYSLLNWNKVIDVNLTGMFLCCQEVGKIMKKQKSGNIININSIYGLVGADQRIYANSGLNSSISYAVTKGAVLNLTRYLASYWNRKNIRVNALTLGGVENNQDKEFAKNYSYRTMLGRMAKKNDYVGAIIFLASNASSYMTGSNLVVDGGWTAW